MSKPKVGAHARIREKALIKCADFYGRISRDDVFEVVQIGTGYGRGAIHLKKTGNERVMMFWRGDVQALPRCEYCDEEGHSKRNCAALKRKCA